MYGNSYVMYVSLDPSLVDYLTFVAIGVSDDNFVKALENDWPCGVES